MRCQCDLRYGRRWPSLGSVQRSIVIKAGLKLEVLAKNEIGEESRASAAVSGGRIFLRGHKNLYCIGTK